MMYFNYTSIYLNKAEKKNLQEESLLPKVVLGSKRGWGWEVAQEKKQKEKWEGHMKVKNANSLPIPAVLSLGTAEELL